MDEFDRADEAVEGRGNSALGAAAVLGDAAGDGGGFGGLGAAAGK